MDSKKRKASHVYNNDQMVKSTKRTTKNRWWKRVQTDINKCKITNWKERLKNRADWENSIKEAKMRTGLLCHLRRIGIIIIIIIIYG